MPELTVERLRELLDYDPETGELTWRVRRGGSVVAGSKAGGLQSNGYVYISIDGRDYLAHRLAWFYTTGLRLKNGVDHINLIKTDNRFENLREATQSQNCANTRRPANNTSGLKGACFDKRRCKWRAVLMVKRKYLHLGYFPSSEDAHDVYMNAARTHFGEFARSE